MSFRLRALGGAVLALLCVLSSVASADTAVFINEIHYDDVDEDIGEAIEVVGPVGTDLSAWRVVLYNGSSPTAATVYDDDALSTAASTTCGSKQIKVLSYPTNGVQNGGADAIALVDAGGSVVQFLSYEGVATASNGPAQGMTSIDIGVSEGGSTAEGTSLQLSGSGSEYGQFAWQPSAAQTFGNCNANQSFGPAVDVPPSVVSTVPAHLATGQANNVNIVVNFSEPVNTVGSWFTLSCSSSGAHAATVSGSGASRTLDPVVDFASGETCTLTVVAGQVTDQDGNADPMQNNFSMNFSTAGDLPPAVASSTPANGAINFPGAANLSVTFTEPVSLLSDWFLLTCDSSGAHTAQVSGGSTTFQLNPDTDLGLIEDCALTIYADKVRDQDGTLQQNMLQNAVISFTTAASGDAYYAGVDTSSGPALKAWLHNRIKNHISVRYSDTYTVMNKADEDIGPGNSDKVWDVYRNESYPKQTSGAANYNREHTWPKSLGFPDETSNGQPNSPHTDGHMLHATHVGYNSDRGNSPYGECDGCTSRPTVANHGVGGGGGGDNNYFNANTFEVWDYRKGDMARAVLYMSVRYQGGFHTNGAREPRLELTDNRSQIVGIDATSCTNGCIGYMGLKSTLLNWNDQDPPDARERLRNDTVYSFQNNRNPFIDHPEWARCVFENVQCPSMNDTIFANTFE